MSVFSIMMKTMKFVWLKLALGLATTVVALVSLGIFFFVGMLFGETGMLVAFCLWGGTILVGIHFINNYFGYLLKAGHVAVVAQAVTDGQLPDDIFKFGTEKVKSRFATSNAYFVVDKLVSGAVRQLQNVVGAIGGLFSFIPNSEKIVDILQRFIRIALGYIDECCLGYCFIHEDENAFKASCDGVVVYFQNAKKLLANAAITTLLITVAVFLSWFLPFLVLGLLFKAMEWNMIICAVLCLFIAGTIKTAFIDSYVMCSMMTKYFELAPQTQITYDLYDKLCKLSSKFKELFNKGQNPETAVAE